MAKNNLQEVDKDLLEAWRKLIRWGDASKMAESIGYSRPIIDRALNDGLFKKQDLVDKISKFFMDRLESEKKANPDQNKLIEMSKEI